MADIWVPGDEELTVHIDTEGKVWVRNTVGMVRRPLDQRTGFSSSACICGETNARNCPVHQ